MQHHLIDMMFRDGVWLNTPVELREQRLEYSDAPMTLGDCGHVAKEDDLRVAAQLGEIPNRRGPSGEAYALEEYVNDRPHTTSSLSVAIARTFGTAMTGRSKQRRHLADRPLAMEARIAVLPCRGREALLSRRFAPPGPRGYGNPSLARQEIPKQRLDAAKSLCRFLSPLLLGGAVGR